MTNDLLDRLPPARDIAREIYETAQRGRRLRALYRVLRSIEKERDVTPEPSLSDSTTKQSEVME